MAVPAYRRKSNTFEIITKTRELAKYTTNITSNDTQFDRKHQWLIDEINLLATSIYLNCFHANNLNLKKENEADERARLQHDALKKCYDFLALIELAKTVFHLRTQRIEFWGNNIRECMTLLKNWIESDRKRKQ